MIKYYSKMLIFLLLVSSILLNGKDKIVYENNVTNTLLKSNSSKVIVSNGLTKEEIVTKIDKVLNSTLEGYGETITTLALQESVDPLVATSIILVETGCKWNCSALVKNCHNVGGMKGKGCGSYGKFSTLDDGLKAFIHNLAKNYYQKGLTTPETINRKYATNPNWYQKVNYYINLIKES